MYRQAIARNARLFSTSVRLNKTVTESAADAVKTADKTVSQTLVKGIEKGEEAAQSTKAAIGVGAKEAKDKAQEVGKQAELKGAELKGEVKGAAKS